MGFTLRLYEHGDEEDGSRTWVGHEVEARQFANWRFWRVRVDSEFRRQQQDIESEVSGRDRACEMRWKAQTSVEKFDPCA